MKPEMSANIASYLEIHRQRMLDELCDLLRIPSVSADSKHRDDVRSAAQWLMERISELGLEPELWETRGHPVVFAEHLVDKNLPTLLMYGHYDVQPPDPLELWDTPPFEPTIKTTSIHPEGAIFARGACDDKGQMYMHIKALEVLKAQGGGLPCNIKLLIEGEEEVGSAHLAETIQEHRNRLDCDLVLISDTDMISRELPSICVGLRGLSYLEVRVDGPSRDLHSGMYGGAVDNPANVLARMIAKLHDDQGRIAIPGFYDEVAELSQQERAALSRAPFNENEYRESIGLSAVFGEAGYSVPERVSIRPSLDVNGMWSGYTGEGAKTVLPATAHAKISMRLVPDQNPRKLTELCANYLKQIAPPTVKVTITPHHGGMPYVAPLDTPAYQAASEAMQMTFGIEPVPVRGGGSIPIVPLFEELLGAKSLLMGFGLASDAIHSPNEHYGVFNFFKGIETLSVFLNQYSTSSERA
ncbi:Acetylornithine deacetylase/Succinyl-diaminopimelate desuccinylase [Ectothiorhodosinus mongolicus]|uniref:Acetylornithine deacetylase/Succinyl-diaminopimelate desuccinylase n=2 Tax=Ectothiorhodosinus mongolicus TaxID=233100 RepID=A0A1R3VMA5_9GAMM|nr:Acetylornithine deacetylase/Succinyl-diaminopimelate desuccinylase [Ectothiorhodosinus mongolicus]